MPVLDSFLRRCGRMAMIEILAVAQRVVGVVRGIVPPFLGGPGPGRLARDVAALRREDAPTLSDDRRRRRGAPDPFTLPPGTLSPWPYSGERKVSKDTYLRFAGKAELATAHATTCLATLATAR